ncbi:hypothetical protein GPECTOR_14g275 [Gonium pectorale]|uniref:Ankyrin repeat domain-containing protein n=1 Tax=Gonium pectorale TaxID=33097 RepID=A0A150GMF1_GONPE|nr:hypothetical protein GPECTOR_14g275 [Gonium pectorale]|eukprot:KXZ51036.1 hypothetical protein GPECTOR_14g275 [Gonium pectorale]
MLAAAARAGKVDLVAELLTAGVAAYESLAWAAVQGGSVQMLRVLVAAGIPLPSNALPEAVSRGNLPEVTWMVEELGMERDSLQACTAAASGSLELVSYLHENGAVVVGMLAECGALGGNIAVLEWLAAHGCIWRAVGSAAWEPGCPVDWDAAVEEAARRAEDDGALVTQWLTERRRRRPFGAALQ